MVAIKSFFSTFQQGLTQLVFPDVCVCCGREPLQQSRHVCSFCIEKRFEHPGNSNPQSTGDVILPDGVSMQFALWKFDKGGMLQNLMHHLKYERLTGIGRQLGKVLAQRVKNHPLVQSQSFTENFLLLPVPLHYLKFRRRGFNQAFSIAKGISRILPVPICDINTVGRKKYTQTQTGFSLQKRIKNMDDAFSVPHPEKISEKKIIIIDDVFTTGSTSFELAKTVINAGAKSAMIWTVAQA